MSFIRLKNGKTKLVQSSRYYDYKKNVERQIAEIKEENKDIFPIKDSINLKCVFYRDSRRRCDLVNLLNAIQDILVDCEVLKDDNYSIVSSVDGSRVDYDKENPRVEIVINFKEK